MTDVQRIIDEVRFCLQTAECELTPELRRLAEEYAALCHEVNSRLRRCGEFLKKGLRAEAMHLAESDPNLLDLFAVVDFSERAEWNEILGIYHLPRPEPLLSDVAEELNEAYSLLLPLEKLLDRHRLLALLQAPVRQRLAIMRKLALADSTSPFWNDDLVTFERVRLAEIETEAHAAASRGDGDALHALAGELAASDWRHPPTDSLVQTVRRLTRQLVADDLAAAHTTGNLDRALLLRERWQALSMPSRATGADTLAGSVAPALKWLAAEDAKSAGTHHYHEKLTALERLLASPMASLVDIEQARKDTLRFGRDIPEPLAGILYTRIVQLKRGTRDRRRRIVGVTAVVGAVVIGMIGLLVRSSLRAGAAKEIVDSADQLISQGRLPEARLALEQPQIVKSDRYLAVHEKLAQAEKKEETRVAEFHSAVEQAQSAQSSAESEMALQAAERLALTNAERLIAGDLRTKLNLKRRDDRGNEEERFQQQLEGVTDLLDRLEDLHRQRQPDPAFFKLFKSAELKIAELKQLATRVKPALARHAEAAEARLARINTDVALVRKRTDLLERLTGDSLIEASQSDPDDRVRQFGADLHEFAEAFPADAKARDFAAAAAEVEFWHAVVAWQQLRARWKTFMPANLVGVKSRLGECEAWLARFPTAPPTAMMREYTAFLRFVVGREEDDSGDENQGIRSKLVRLYSGPLLEDVQVIDFNDGRSYYVKTRFEARENEKNGFHFLTGAKGETKAKFVSTKELKLLRSREAPQAALCKKIRRMLSLAALDNWDHSLLEIAEVLRGDDEMHPFLRYYLLLETLENAQDSSLFLKPELERAVSDLHDRGIDLTAHWMNPEDAAAARMKPLAIKKLQALGDLKPLWRRAAQHEETLRDRVFQTVFPVGWLATDEKQNWQCKSTWTPQMACSLWIAAQADNEKSAQWLKIGEAAPGGAVSIRKDALQRLKEGRLVFAREGKEIGDPANEQ